MLFFLQKYINQKISDFFFAQDKVHQGYFLSPLLLVIVKDALTECEG